MSGQFVFNQTLPAKSVVTPDDHPTQPSPQSTICMLQNRSALRNMDRDAHLITRSVAGGVIFRRDIRFEDPILDQAAAD
jgi:hypothetical protein